MTGESPFGITTNRTLQEDDPSKSKRGPDGSSSVTLSLPLRTRIMRRGNSLSPSACSNTSWLCATDRELPAPAHRRDGQALNTHIKGKRTPYDLGESPGLQAIDPEHAPNGLTQLENPRGTP
jgi:hypothetical protein